MARRWTVFFLLSVVLLTSSLPAATSDSYFSVAKGATARSIAAQLYQEGYLWHPWTFLIWVKVSGKRDLRPGLYPLSKSWTGWTIFRTLRKGPPLLRVTFPEGWTAKQMGALLENRHIVTEKEFMDDVTKQHLEGRLFPDTYAFEQGLPASHVTARMTQRFEQMKPKDLDAQAKVLSLSPAKIITLASIVEREARVAEERPVIAGVFYNRIKKHWRLESCATVEYALGQWKPRLTYKDLKVESPYNTYLHAGLPPGPIGNPGAAALEAAAHPAATDMMFFVADGQGTHRFSKYYDQHLAVQKKKKRNP